MLANNCWSTVLSESWPGIQCQRFQVAGRLSISNSIITAVRQLFVYTKPTVQALQHVHLSCS